MVDIPVNDDFTGNDGDPANSVRWETIVGAQSGSIAIFNNKLRLTVPESASDEYAWVASRFWIEGDFDIQIDYDEVSSDNPSSSVSYPVSFRIYTANGNNYRVFNTRESSGTRNTGVVSSGSSAVNITHIPSGKMRFTRSGSTVKAYVWSNSQWEWNGNTAGYTFSLSDNSNITQVVFSVHADFDSGAVTDFDNFIVNSGDHFWLLASVRGSWEQSFLLVPLVRKTTLQSFALKERRTWHQVFRDADKLRRAWLQLFGDTGKLRRQWHHKFGDAVQIRKTCEQVFSIPGMIRMVCFQDFSVTADVLRKVTYQDWSIKDVEVLRQTYYQVFAVAGVEGEARQYTVSVAVNGVTVPNPARVNLERDIDLYYIEAVLSPAIQEHYKLYPHKATVDLNLNGTTYTLVITTPKRDRRHGGGSYSIELQSPAVLLGEKYADTISGELTGFASEIAAQVAPGFVIDWQAHDEYYSPGSFIAADEYPIEIIRRLAEAVMAKIQSQPDGSIRIVRRKKTRVDQLESVTPDYTLSDVDDFSTVSEEPVRRKRYNAYTVRNQNESDQGLRMDTKDISKTVKEVLGYQTPWDGNFDLTHTGGAWVVIQPLGIEERTETEVIEFVDGKGQSRFPIYSWSGLEWQQNNLGTITFSEDGSLEADVAGDSLLSLTYTTRCKLWQVTDPRDEQLQLVSEEVSE